MSHNVEDGFAEFFAESAKAADASLTADIHAQIEAGSPRVAVKITPVEALELIASRGCVCGGGYCRHLKWLPRADWCSPCIAADAIASQTPSPPASVPPGREVNAHPGPPSHGDHEAGPGCASDLP